MNTRAHKLLVIGGGSIGERHVRCARQIKQTSVALVEINPQLRQTLAERYDVPTFENLDAAPINSFTAAIIATPAPLHVPMALRLAEAGLHLLIEKPLSTTVEGIDRLMQVVSSRQLKAAVAYVYRAHPALAAMREAIRSGRFGNPVQIVSTSGQHFPTYRPAYRKIYYASRDSGGGAVQDALTHVINTAEWLVGPVDRLMADAAHQLLDGVDVEDTVHLLARHGDVMGSYALNQHQAPNEARMTVVCQHGSARFEFPQNRWQWMTQPGGEWNQEGGGPMERDDMYIQQIKAFLDAIEGKRDVLCSLSEGLQTLKVNLAALATIDSSPWTNVQ